MKSDDQVLEEATEIIRNQWCAGRLRMNGAFDHDLRLWVRLSESRYCAVGAIQKVLEIDRYLDGHFEDEVAYLEEFLPRELFAQYERVVARIRKAMGEQYPELGEGTGTAHDAFAIEVFNDSRGRDEMLALFEKAKHL